MEAGCRAAAKAAGGTPELCPEGCQGPRESVQAEGKASVQAPRRDQADLGRLPGAGAGLGEPGAGGEAPVQVA